MLAASRSFVNLPTPASQGDLATLKVITTMHKFGFRCAGSSDDGVPKDVSGGQPNGTSGAGESPDEATPSSRPHRLSSGAEPPSASKRPLPAISCTSPSRTDIAGSAEKVATGFKSDAAIEALGEHLSTYREKLGIISAQLADSDEIKTRLAKGKRLPLLPGYETWAGVIDRAGRIQSNDKELVQLLGQLNPRTLSAHDIPKDGLPIAVLVKNPWTVDAHEEYLKQVINHFQAAGTIPGKKDNVFEYQETVTWPFFRDVIAGTPPALSNSALADGISELPGYELVAPEVSKRTLDSLHDTMAPQRLRLLGVDLAELQYSGRADWKDTAVSLSLSSMIGSGGDFLIHRIFPDDASYGNPAVYVAVSVAKVLLLITTDIGDNAIGELETARGDLLANNMTPSLKTFTGAENLRELAINILKRQPILEGDGRVFARRALRAGFAGATLGAIPAAALGFLITNNSIDTLPKALLGGLLSLGFALSIPVDFRSAVKQVQSAVLELMDEGKIPIPEGGFADEAEKMRYAREITLQELVSRQSNSSSARALSVAPVINGGILALPIPSEIREMLFMGVAPPMENISKLADTVWETKVERPLAMSRLGDLVLSTPGGFTESAHESQLAHSFARRWPHGVAGAITIGAKPPSARSEVIDTEEAAGA